MLALNDLLVLSLQSLPPRGRRQRCEQRGGERSRGDQPQWGPRAPVHAGKKASIFTFDEDLPRSLCFLAPRTNIGFNQMLNWWTLYAWYNPSYVPMIDPIPIVDPIPMRDQLPRLEVILMSVICI